MALDLIYLFTAGCLEPASFIKKQAGADSPHPIACTLTAKLIYAALE